MHDHKMLVARLLHGFSPWHVLQGRPEVADLIGNRPSTVINCCRVSYRWWEFCESFSILVWPLQPSGWPFSTGILSSSGIAIWIQFHNQWFVFMQYSYYRFSSYIIIIKKLANCFPLILSWYCCGGKVWQIWWIICDSPNYKTIQSSIVTINSYNPLADLFIFPPNDWKE